MEPRRVDERSGGPDGANLKRRGRARLADLAKNAADSRNNASQSTFIGSSGGGFRERLPVAEVRAQIGPRPGAASR